MQRKSSLGEQRVPVIYPHSTSASSARWMRTTKNELNDDRFEGKNIYTNVLCEAWTFQTFSQFYRLSTIQTEKTRVILSFFPTASYHSCTILKWDGDFPCNLFSLFTLYKINTQKWPTMLYYVSMYRLTTGFLHCFVYFTQRTQTSLRKQPRAQLCDVEDLNGNFISHQHARMTLIRDANNHARFE